MSKITSKVELTTNLIVITVALILGVVLVQKYILTSGTSERERLQPTIGSKVQMTDYAWPQESKTLFMVLQTTCHFCNESAPFYNRLAEEVRGRNIKLVAVFPTPVGESTTHMSSLGLSGFEVRQAAIASLQVSGTPTLILANPNGEVEKFWQGKLQSDKEQEVISTLTN